MAENEHDSHECEARTAKVRSLCDAADALLSMSAFDYRDKPFMLEELVNLLSGRRGAHQAETAWEGLRDICRDNGRHHGKPSAETRQRVIGRLMEQVGLIETAPADTFHHLSVVSGGSW